MNGIYIVRLASYYLMAACVAVWLAVLAQSFVLSVLLGWISGSLLIVGMAYLLNNPGIFRKRADGSIPTFIRIFFVPFMLGAHSINWYKRRTDRVPAVQKIDDYLYLAARLTRNDIDMLQQEKVHAILDVTCEFAGIDWSSAGDEFEYLNVPILDHAVPSPAQLNQAIGWVHQHVSEGKAVVIHCALGRGRSVMVLAAYLLGRSPQVSIDAVQQHIRLGRQTANMNKRQLRVLGRYQSEGYLRHETRMALIANPVSGRKEWAEKRPAIEARLSPFFNLSIFETTQDISATQLAQQALAEGADILVACGGDGTIVEVADCVINSDATLGIIPFGTANALSHVLYGIGTKFIPIESACDILIAGERRKIDTARTNGDLMLLMTGIGFEQQMIAEADRGKKNEQGQLAYIRGFMSALSENEVIGLSLTLDDGHQRDIEVSSLVVANAAPFSSLLAQGKGEPVFTDGLLDVTWIEAGDHIPASLSMAELMLNAATSTNLSGFVKHEQAKRIHIVSDSKLKYAIDGELHESANIQVEVCAASLWVMAGEASDGAGDEWSEGNGRESESGEVAS